MLKFLLSFLVFLTILIGHPSVAMADNDFGPLKDLVGTWKGDGWNTIAVHLKDDEPGTSVQHYTETLTFEEVGKVPNRGEPQDQFLMALRYKQEVKDDNGNVIHFEDGLWLLLDENRNKVARQTSVPHGDSLLALGKFINFSDKKVDFLKKGIDGSPHNLGPIKFKRTDFHDKDGKPLSFDSENINQPLKDALEGQTISGFGVLDVSTCPGGGVLNIPFIQNNADVSQLSSIFWIENVKDEQGNKFQQLQYTQESDLLFLGEIWPHFDVATLVKQVQLLGDE